MDQQPSSIDWKHLLLADRNFNHMVVRATCDSIRRNLDNPARILELLSHLENTFPHHNAPEK